MGSDQMRQPVEYSICTSDKHPFPDLCLAMTTLATTPKRADRSGSKTVEARCFCKIDKFCVPQPTELPLVSFKSSRGFALPAQKVAKVIPMFYSLLGGRTDRNLIFIPVRQFECLCGLPFRIICFSFLAVEINHR